MVALVAPVALVVVPRVSWFFLIFLGFLWVFFGSGGWGSGGLCGSPGFCWLLSDKRSTLRDQTCQGVLV